MWSLTLKKTSKKEFERAFKTKWYASTPLKLSRSFTSREASPAGITPHFNLKINFSPGWKGIYVSDADDTFPPKQISKLNNRAPNILQIPDMSFFDTTTFSSNILSLESQLFVNTEYRRNTCQLSAARSLTSFHIYDADNNYKALPDILTNKNLFPTGLQSTFFVMIFIIFYYKLFLRVSQFEC